MEEYSPYLSAFLQTFLSIVLPVLAAFLAGLAVQGVRLLQAKIKESRPDIYGVLSFLVDAGVKASEQANLAGLITDKKAFCIKFVQDRLAIYGLNIDVGIIESEIEKGVFEVLNDPKLLVQ